MTDRSAFTPEEWEALVDAPLLIAYAMVAVGDHGPISMLKESTATAKAIAQPHDHGEANRLIAEIAVESKGKQARHDAKEHKAATIPLMVDGLIADLAGAAKVIDKLPAAEGNGIRDWLVSIARAVAAASKGVKPEEEQTIERIVQALGASG
jgi:hypothetical protein